MTSIGTCAVVGGAWMMVSAGVLAEPQCSRGTGSDQDDGRYRWFFDSWVEDRGEKFSFGRCVGAIDPRSIRAHWVEVVPAGVARRDRPLRSSIEFLSGSAGTAMSDLWYGSSDDKVVDAPYIANELELGAQQVLTEPITEEQLKELTASGPVTLSSTAGCSIAPTDEPSGAPADIEFEFASAVHQSGFVEHAIG